MSKCNDTMKPGDFNLGVSEFLSILIPGAIVIAVLCVTFQVLDYNNISTGEWAALLVASYILGHLLFALGSYWDDLYIKVKPKGNDGLLDKIHVIRKQNESRDCADINKYKWSKAILSDLHSEGYYEVVRKEADSKLFRSLLFPLLISSAAAFMTISAWWGAVLLILSIVSFMRYREQRFKACTTAYTHTIIQYQLGKLQCIDQT